ncbi:maleylpyruvate isomerase N-terminal domain-containing protein [Streptomyces sp. NPDC058045]|uniref:maleylpyruvate isomerase N-terminal domain-containing protein n=1 Tax=Streptomyces sp. NPDC058045 TaxID=3346311 RepID=UPI0036E0B50E
MSHADRYEPFEEPDDENGPPDPYRPPYPFEPSHPYLPRPPAQAKGPGGVPRIPMPRSAVEDSGRALPEPEPAPLEPLPHPVLKSLLGAWALAACSPQESAAVEEHLGECGPCAEEALRLRDAVGLLHPAESLDLDPTLRTRVLESCLDRRPPRIPVPPWAAPYDAETARLDALLKDIGDAEWHTPVRLGWYEDDGSRSRRTTVAGVIAHLLAVDGLVALVLGLEDPLGADTPLGLTRLERTEAAWRAGGSPPTREVRGPWREQSHHLVRTAAVAAGDGAGSGARGGLPVPGERGPLPLRDVLVERAFECWIHADDIAQAVDYPYEPPAPRHLHGMIDLAARLLPGMLAERRRSGLAAPAREAAGAGRSLRLEIEGAGGGEWLVSLDGPRPDGTAEQQVAHVALDAVEFCRLAAGRVPPCEAAAGGTGDRAAIKDLLTATAALSRL